jgi:polysaccharide export outer membrane protein
MLLAVGFIGCGSTPEAQHAQSTQPWTPPSTRPSAAGPAAPSAAASASFRLRVGDMVIVTFSDLPPLYKLEEHKERVRDDGKITLPYNISVAAVGHTPGELQDIIRTNYVPSYFKYLTVTVKTEERFYYVGGEVRMPSRLPYLGELTVLRAVESAGGFTDFSDRKRVQLIRANGEKFVIDCKRVLKDPKRDLTVHPGDYVNVPRRWM